MNQIHIMHVIFWDELDLLVTFCELSIIDMLHVFDSEHVREKHESKIFIFNRCSPTPNGRARNSRDGSA